MHHPSWLNSFCCLLQYTTDVLYDELGLGEDAESDGDESDEDLLCNQL